MYIYTHTYMYIYIFVEKTILTVQFSNGDIFIALYLTVCSNIVNLPKIMRTKYYKDFKNRSSRNTLLFNLLYIRDSE